MRPELLPPSPLLAIGPVTFNVSTEQYEKVAGFVFSTASAAYDKLQRSSAWEWSEQRRIGAKPVLQYTGPESETITLSGTIYPIHRNVGIGQIDKLRALADKGEPHALADGRGNFLGMWVIKSITEDQSNHLPGGAPRKQEYHHHPCPLP